MSGVAIVRYLLASHAPLLALVPATRIVAGVLPSATVLPAIVIRQISASERSTVAATETAKFVTERVQVTALAPDYPQQKTLLALIRAALPATRGTINGIACDSITPDIEGPDLYARNPEIYEQSRDYLVRHHR